MDDSLLRLGDALDGVTRRLGLGEAQQVGKVWRHWEDIVGPEIAAHAEPTSLREGVLRVRTDSPAWATEITYLVADLRARINAAVGESAVKEIKVWSGPGPVARRGHERSRTNERAVEKSESADPVEAVERARRAWLRRRS